MSINDRTNCCYTSQGIKWVMVTCPGQDRTFWPSWLKWWLLALMPKTMTSGFGHFSSQVGRLPYSASWGFSAYICAAFLIAHHTDHFLSFTLIVMFLSSCALCAVGGLQPLPKVWDGKRKNGDMIAGMCCCLSSCIFPSPPVGRLAWIHVLCFLLFLMETYSFPNHCGSWSWRRKNCF